MKASQAAVTGPATAASGRPEMGTIGEHAVVLGASLGGLLAARVLAGYARERLAHYKIPRHYEFGDLPKTSTGKHQKEVLRHRARELKEKPASAKTRR